MLTRWEGLTSVYNRFHDPDETSTDIDRLRCLHREMDMEVARAYGWDDLDLCHAFRHTARGLRYTMSEGAEKAIVERLLQLNRQRYAGEVVAGLHLNGKTSVGKSAKKGRRPTDSDDLNDEQLAFHLENTD